MTENTAPENPAPLKKGPLWHSSPSSFHYAGTYLIAIIAIWILHMIQMALSPAPYELVMVYGGWSRPLADWSFSDWPLIVITLCYLTMLVFIASALFKYLQAKMTSFTVDNDQIIVRQLSPVGILEKRTELYRLVDFSKTQTFVDTLFGLSTLQLRSTDANTPLVKVYGIRNGAAVIALIREETERCRVLKGVREITSPGYTIPADK